MAVNENCGISTYGDVVFDVHAKVNYNVNSGTYEAFGCISSIDDSGLSFFHPAETKEKAEKRRDAFAAWVKTLRFMAPTPEQVNMYCKNNLATAGYW